MKRVIAATLLLSTLAYPASRAAADDVPTSLSFNVSAGGFAFANRDQLKDNPVFDMRIGYDVIGNSVLDSIGIEGGLSYISTQSRKDHSPVDAYLFRVDATYPFFPRSRVVPFVTIGAGGMFMSKSNSTDKAPVLAYGLGLKYFVQEFIAVRADFRHNLLFDIHTRNDFQYMIGLSFLLDRDKKIRRLPLPPPPPKEKPQGSALAVPVIEPEKPANATPAAASEKPAAAPAPVPVPIHLEPEQPKVQPEKEEPPALPMLLPLVPAAPVAIAADALAPAPIAERKAAPLAAEPKAVEPQSQALEGKTEPGGSAQSIVEPAPVQPPPAPKVEPPAAKVVPPPAPPVEPPAPKVEPPAPKVETPAPQVEPPPAPPVEPPAPRVEPPAPKVEPPAPRVQLETPPPSPAAPQVKIEQPYQLPEEGSAPQEQPEEEVVASILCPDAPPAGSKPRQLAEDSVTVLFDSGSAVVKPGYMPELKEIASYLKKHPESSVYIEGHTDNVGRPDSNMKLSMKRVASVKKSLTKTLGRAKAKILTAAFGCRIPVDTNKKESGRQKNRRATVEVKK